MARSVELTFHTKLVNSWHKSGDYRKTARLWIKMSEDLEIVRRILCGKLQTDTCRFCMCELPNDSEHVNMSDTIINELGEMALRDLLNREYQRNFEFCSGSDLSEMVCITCFTKVQASSYRIKKKPHLNILEHYTKELYDNLENMSALGDDVKTIVLYLRSQNEQFQQEKESVHNTESNYDAGSVIKQEFLQFEVPPVKQEKTDEKPVMNEDLVIMADENGEAKAVYSLNDVVDNEELEIYYYPKTAFQPMKISVPVEIEDETMGLLPKLSEKRRHPLTCRICKKKCYSIKWLTRHMIKDHNIIICEECGHKFTEKEYSEHIKKKTLAYTCDVCGQGFKFKHSIILHLDKHERERCKLCVCETCGALLWDATALANHVATNHERSRIAHTCYYCGKGYRSLGSFEAHIRKHEKTHTYQCSDCGVFYATRSDFNCHIWSAPKHTCRPHTCVDCNKVFGSLNALRIHQLSHNKQGVHRCQDCDRSFVDGRSLKWHRRLHSGERPHLCAECGRGFVSRQRRNQHALTAHTVPQKQCPLCPALFHLHSMVNTHIKKVHLRDHKRRARTPKRVDVQWQTQRATFPDLSVHVQSQLLARSIQLDA